MPKTSTSGKLPSKSTMTRRLDALCRLLFKAQREEYGLIRCDMCGNRYPYGVVGINLAHIEGRSKKALTWEPMNWLALCNGVGESCHGWFDQNKVAGAFWLKENFPEKAAWLCEVIDGKPRSAHLFDEKVPDMLEREERMKQELSTVSSTEAG